MTGFSNEAQLIRPRAARDTAELPRATRCRKNLVPDTQRHFCYLIPTGKQVLITYHLTYLFMDVPVAPGQLSIDLSTAQLVLKISHSYLTYLFTNGRSPDSPLGNSPLNLKYSASNFNF